MSEEKKEVQVEKIEDKQDEDKEEKKSMKKHPLQYNWTLWYDYPGRKNTASTYDLFLQKVYTFSTVEDFWSVYNFIMKPSSLPNGSNYRLFKEGVEPKWEDPSNEKGGSWTVTLLKNKTFKNNLDDMWLYLMLACIGDTLGDGELICGVIVSIRKKEDRLIVWTKDSETKEEIVKIGEAVKAHCELDIKIEFKTHQDMIKVLNSNSRPKAKYVV